MSTMDTTGFLCINSIGSSEVLLQQWRGNTHFLFLGASCPTNAPSSYERLTMLTVQPRKGKKDVIAVAVTAEADDKKRADLHANFLLLATVEEGQHEGKPWVDNENLFAPVAGRLGGIIGRGSSAMLSAQIDGRTYVYPPLALECKDVRKLSEKGYIVVNDGNVLCRYMTGEATAKEVEKAVVAKSNQSIFEALAEAEMRASEHIAERDRLDLLLVRQGGELDTTRQELEKIKKLYESLVVAADGILHAQPRTFWKSPSRLTMVESLVARHKEHVTK